MPAQERLHRLSRPHLGQAHHGDDGRRDPEPDLGEAELDVLGRDRDVESRGQTVAASDDVTLAAPLPVAPERSFRLAPAQKVLPSFVTTTARTPGSALAVAMAS
jgi:hypothetical protein